MVGSGPVERLFLDLETHLIIPGRQSPPIVCAQLGFDRADPIILQDLQKLQAVLLEIINNTEAVIIGHNIAFDLCCLLSNGILTPAQVFTLYVQNRVYDTGIRAKLIDLSRGQFKDFGYSLAKLALYAGIELDKTSDTRTSFEQVQDTPLEEWPQRYIDYAKEDIIATREVFWQQLKHEDILEDQHAQSKGYFALKLMENWGIKTNVKTVLHIKEKVFKEHNYFMEKLVTAGLMKVNPKRECGYSKDLKALKALVVECYEGNPPRKEPTEKMLEKGISEGNIQTDRETLESAPVQTPVLKDLRGFSKADHIWNTYIPAFEKGIDTPIHCWYGFAATGRTTCAKPNLQNQPRKYHIQSTDEYVDIRKVFEARPGKVFIACDYDSIELRSWAQVCLWLLGESSMAGAFKLGLDPHLQLAAQFLHISYEEALTRKKGGDKEVLDRRQFAKIPNFGFPGGLGPDTFVKFARGYGIDITREEAVATRDVWFEAWPEARLYFRHINGLMDDMNKANIIQLVSGRHRGDCTFTQACNSFFQGLTADGAKNALFNIARASYSQPDSPLYRSRPVVFIHDEIIIEAPEESTDSCAKELERIMCASMAEYIPDIPITAEAVAMKRWRKDATRTLNEDGKLIACDKGAEE